jgi:molecular chaperone HtpG
LNTAAVPITLLERAAALESIDDEIIIGKDVLELVTGAMYADPLSVYREYMQNAADAIDEARATERFEGKAYSPKVSIAINRESRSVTIRDNGAGVPNAEFVGRLSAIGGSKKRGTQSRGFRGVGRLSGLGYCQEVVFRSRALGDKKVLEIHWDGRRLREILRDAAFQGGLADSIRAVAKVRTAQPKETPAHFFEVELRKVARVKNDVLLNEETVRNYLAQVAPVPFHPEFRAGRFIQEFLADFKIGGTFDVELNDGAGSIYRPFRDELPVTEKQNDMLHSPEFFKIPGLDEEIAAVGWTLQHSYYGAWPRRLAVGGLRTRLGNLQIGGSDFFAPHFVEPRFNQWSVGEVHVVSARLTPNGRRDDFEHSGHYDNFVGQMAPRLAEITRICREKSELRQKLKTANQHVQRGRHAILALRSRTSTPLQRKVAEWQCVEALESLLKMSKGRALGEAERRLVLGEHEHIGRELGKWVTRFAGRDPLRGLRPGLRKDVEPILRLVFERVRNPKKAEDLARRILQAFR